MNYILDTHAFLWTLFDPRRLSPNAREILLHTDGPIFVSAITFWEVALKYALGKLDLCTISPDELPRCALDSGFEILAFETEDAATFHRLIRVAHADPFDRMLVWQTIRRKWTLISCDRAFTEYASHGLSLLW